MRWMRTSGPRTPLSRRRTASQRRLVAASRGGGHQGVREVDVGDLPAGVHTGVGAARHGERCSPCVRSTVSIACSRSPCTVRSPDCLAQPWKPSRRRRGRFAAAPRQPTAPPGRVRLGCCPRAATLPSRLALLLVGCRRPRYRRGDAAHRGPRLGRLLDPGQRRLDRRRHAVPRRQHRDQRWASWSSRPCARCGPGSAPSCRSWSWASPCPAAAACSTPRRPCWASAAAGRGLPGAGARDRRLPRHPPRRRSRGGRRLAWDPPVPFRWSYGAVQGLAPWSAGCSAPRSDRGRWR